MACSDFLQPYIDWLEQGYLNIVTVVAVSIRFNQGCYYLEGVFDTYDGTQMTGSGKQYFNDRRAGTQPFDQNATDKVGLALAIPNGPLTMTLQSWGNVLMPYALECKDNLLFGYLDDIVVVLSLGKSQRIM
jgi:hypothetical protein